MSQTRFTPYIPGELEVVEVISAPKVRCKDCGAFLRRRNEEVQLCSVHQAARAKRELRGERRGSAHPQEGQWYGL